MLGQITIEDENVKRSIEVSYYKPIDMLGDFGGVMQVILVVIGLITNTISSM